MIAVALRSCLLLALLTLQTSSAARILLLPSDHKGHVNFFAVAARELQDRGHEVLVLAQHRNKHIVEKYGVPSILNEATEHSPTEDSAMVESLYTSGLQQFLNTLNMASKICEGMKLSCYETMQNEDIMKKLQAQKFDVALTDGIDFARCLYVIPYKLGIPYITLTARQDPWATGLPAFPSVEGFFGLVIMKSDSSYLQIFKNLAVYLATYIMSPPPAFKDSQIKELAPEKPETTYNDLYKASEVFLINFDNTCLDYSRVEGPHYRFIGGMAATPPKPLPKEFEEFVSKADAGLIVVSFGSLFKKAPVELMRKMMVAFRDLPQRVVMRYDGELSDIPDNVMLSKWLPQNDLLGHSKTRLFIAHGGNNGQMEALFHGTPLVVMPFFGDQLYSAERTVDKQYGVTINPLDFTSEELRAAIAEVLTNPVYAQNIKKCSAISKSFPSAHEQIESWVQHVVKFGRGSVFKPVSMDMPLYRVFMLDVLLIVLLCSVLLCYCSYRCCSCVCKRCRSGGKQKVKKN